jgi:hypothetical protein
MEPSDKISSSLLCSVFNNPRTRFQAHNKLESLRLGRAMAGIAQNIERYNSAYRLAWKHISELQKRVNSNIALRLHNSIRRQLQEGATEPLFIASEALKALDEN